MAVGTSVTERIDTCTPNSILVGPVAGLLDDLELAISEVDLGVELLDANRSRDLACFQGVGHLHDTGHGRRCFGVADIWLDASDQQRLAFGAFWEKDIGDTFQFNWVANSSSRALDSVSNS